MLRNLEQALPDLMQKSTLDNFHHKSSCFFPPTIQEVQKNCSNTDVYIADILSGCNQPDLRHPSNILVPGHLKKPQILYGYINGLIETLIHSDFFSLSGVRSRQSRCRMTPYYELKHLKEQAVSSPKTREAVWSLYIINYWLFKEKLHKQ